MSANYNNHVRYGVVLPLKKEKRQKKKRASTILIEYDFQSRDLKRKDF